MTALGSIKQELDEAAAIIRMQTARIAELEAELECLRSSLDAHGTLRLIYSNPNSPEGNRIKAAAAALPVERPKLMPERAPLDLTAEKPIEPLQDRVVRLMAREDRLHGFATGGACCTYSGR
jgi:hypothetical protein